MTQVNDGFDSYYAERLWQLLPAVYRTTDTDSFTSPGPLRELVNRIGAQIAVVRRSMDRLWADQSIETCDDWVIPYLGGLLGTNLVNRLDPAGQRLDVAKTIHYRRHKGTVEVLEELAFDVTGWPAHVIEGFRRLGRTRHGLDPAVGTAGYPGASPADTAQLLRTEGLAGLLTGALAGGLADLRSAHGASLAGTAFDEAFHTADFRAGLGAVGHFGIPRLLVFLWRLISFQVVAGTPVVVTGCTDQYVFDPTGRQVPLFLPPPPVVDDFSENWMPAVEWQVPGPLTASLEAALDGPTYPDAPPASSRYAVNGADVATIWPELGRFETTAAPPSGFTVNYQYGFASRIGAGPYDRDLARTPPVVAGASSELQGGSGLGAALTNAGATGTVVIGDSLTYTDPGPAGSSAAPIVNLLVQAGPVLRPVVRPAAGAGPWIFTGGPVGPGGEGGQLVLDGLTVAGCDVVLRGSFETVRITACTIDPGTAAPASDPPLGVAVDGVTLAPCRVFVEGTIASLVIDHCVLGPVRTRFGGAVETLSVSDSVVQGLAATAGSSYTSDDIFDPALLAQGLMAANPLAEELLGAMPAAASAAVRAYAAEPPADQAAGFPAEGLDGLNALVSGPLLYDQALFQTVSLSADVLALLAERAGSLDAAGLATLNRGLIDEAFPVALGVAALAVADATVQLSAVTVLGRVAAQELWASDTILRDFTAVDNTQNGCVRFSAYAAGSVIPRQYESVQVSPGAPLFTSDAYGQPGYAQLLESAGAAILSGADNGSELGAFSADLNPVKEQGLLIKYAEYMPLGLTPVIVHVT